MTVLIIGGSGMLGQALFHTAPVPVIGTHNAFAREGHYALDLSKESPNAICQKVKPSYIIYAAALTDISLCEKFPEMAHAIHVKGVEECRSYCEKNNVPFMYVSTSYVFDGKKGMYKETDLPSPINIYGTTKLLGEKVTQQFHTPTLIVRVNHFHYLKKNNLTWPFDTLDQKEVLKAYRGVIFSAMYVKDMAKILWELVQKRTTGLYHIGTTVAYSRKDFLEKILSQLKRSHVVQEVIPEFTNRPLNTSLNVQSIQKLSIILPDPETTLHHMTQDFLKRK